MNDLAGAIMDGLSIAGIHWRLVLGILLILIVSQLLLLYPLKWVFEEQFSGEETVSLSLAGWLLPACLISLLWYALAQAVSLQFSTTVIAILLIAGLALSLRDYRATLQLSNTGSISLVLAAGLFIILRLAFVSKAVVPLYFDSAQHYRFINELLTNLGTEGAGIQSQAGYYHLGFHFLAAFITFLNRSEITDTMLVLGQIMLALMPLSVFFIVRHWTGSNSAGFLAVALAAFGWYMPAHAMDWGKYPALASLALMPFVLSLAYLSFQSRHILPTKRFGALILLLVAGLLVSTFLHSRSLVVYGLLALAWLITSAWNQLGKRFQFMLLIFVILSLLGEIVFIQSQAILGPLIDAYGRDAVLISILVLVLSTFAWWAYPSLVFFCVLTTSFILASLFVPLGSLIPGYANTTLLDRPYVQMLLYLPLTLLGGFGLGGLEQILQGRSFIWKDIHLSWSNIIAGFFIALVAVNALYRYDPYPAGCCEIVSRDDLAAIHWMDENLPEDALILTSSTDLRVLPTDKFQGSAGGDAGTWITPLTGRPVAFMPFNTDFSQRQTLDALCQQQMGYVYVGKTGWYFDDSGMSMQPEAYKLLLDLPKARVYAVRGCK